MAEALAGSSLVRAARVGTVVIASTSAAGAAAPGAMGLVHAVASCAAFVVGTGALAWAYAVGISRSREEHVTLSGLFFLAGGVAPRPLRRDFGILLLTEVVAVVVAASIRPYTEVAFGILAPMYALGLMALWGARFGEFQPRSARP